VYSQAKKSKRKHEGTSAVESAIASKKQKQSVVEKTAEESVDYKPQGWISSLFVNNPDIPAFAHRVVKPVSEPVFSSQNFKDLPVHPFTVSDAGAVLCGRLGFRQMGAFLCLKTYELSKIIIYIGKTELCNIFCGTKPNRKEV
jgi:hypothetical protein